MSASSFLTLWLTFPILQLVFAVAACVQRTAPGSSRPRRPLYAAAGASAVPLVTLCLFARAFVVGRVSSVAQLAGDDGYDLWRLWAEAWLPLLFANFLAFVAAVAALATPPWGWASVLSRVAAVVFVLCAWFALLRWFPTA